MRPPGPYDFILHVCAGICKGRGSLRRGGRDRRRVRGRVRGRGRRLRNDRATEAPRIAHGTRADSSGPDGLPYLLPLDSLGIEPLLEGLRLILERIPDELPVFVLLAAAVDPNGIPIQFGREANAGQKGTYHRAVDGSCRLKGQKRVGNLPGSGYAPLRRPAQAGLVGG